MSAITISTVSNDWLSLWIEKSMLDKGVSDLVNMPDWEFCLVFRDGLGDACAGCEYKGAYYSEWQIAAAYLCKYPESDPLF